MKMMTKQFIPIYTVYTYWSKHTTKNRSVLEVWAFNDTLKNIFNEPFVGNTNNIISELAKDIPNAEKGFWLEFSVEPFKDCYPQPLIAGIKDGGGCWYSVKMNGSHHTGWLCSKIYSYYPACPKKLWVRAIPDESKDKEDTAHDDTV